ncbi:MAG TPA: protein phosphatase 2C domain-containing protein [Streptosporangiaceae bacterium]|nr:protein phosphatase 2C domain-containing protein [Streptosporangiaceae bacterium]
MSTDASELPPPGAQDLWLALTASQLGAAHQATGLPNQDAVAARQVRADVLVVAVADGHGHRRHFRSARGSQLAVAVACEAAQELAARLDEFQTAAPIESEALGTLVPAIAGEWRDAVREDVAADPFTSREEASRGGDDPLIAYGSTLLLAIAGRRWLVLVQIGDGDIMGIQPDGRPLLPVPRDPSLDGQLTTSLCGPGAEDEFRAAVVDTSTTPLLGVILATDGYGNAQVADPWADAVSADLAELINDRPPEWLAGQLPLWASRCASADGSADDTTIALLIAPSATGWHHDVPDEPAADEATTAARRLAEPTTQPSLRGPARASAGRSRRLIVIAAAAVVIAAVAAFLAIQLSSSPGSTPIPGTTPASCSSPSATAGQHATASATAGPHAGAVGNPCQGGKAGG